METKHTDALKLAEWVAADTDAPNYLVKLAFDFLRSHADAQKVQEVLNQRDADLCARAARGEA